MASRLIARSSFGLCHSTARSTSLRLSRTFAVSSSRSIKESSGDDKDYDKHKQDLLAKQQSGKAHWKPELASDGEEAVRADRRPKEDISKLQEKTKQHLQEKDKTGTSGKDPM